MQIVVIEEESRFSSVGVDHHHESARERLAQQDETLLAIRMVEIGR
jgi:hypothetical protein